MTVKNYVLYRAMTINGKTVHTFFKYGTDNVLNGMTDSINAATKFTEAQARKEYNRHKKRAIAQGYSIGFGSADNFTEKTIA